MTLMTAGPPTMRKIVGMMNSMTGIVIKARKLIGLLLEPRDLIQANLCGGDA